MTGLLIKRGKGNYKLYINDTPFATTEKSPYKRLSIDNCETIFNGYDLEDLVDKYAEDWKYDERIGFREGFQKAIEILGDKKFSELDMRISYDAGCNNIDSDGDPIDEYNIDFYDTINSLQQTEWDVEIVLEVINHGKGEDGLLQETVEPKLDADGCLILKRNSYDKLQHIPQR
jgi:hypothetical protein